MKDLNVPAFPLNTPRWHEELNQQGWLGGDFTTGMTLRDYFAAKAMEAHIGRDDVWVAIEQNKVTPEKICYGCYAWADSMLKAREA